LLHDGSRLHVRPLPSRQPPLLLAVEQLAVRLPVAWPPARGQLDARPAFEPRAWQPPGPEAPAWRPPSPAATPASGILARRDRRASRSPARAPGRRRPPLD